MNGEFATLLVDGILRSEYRSSASVPDMDLVAVVKHAIAGNTRRTLRDIAVVALFVVAVASR
ncbi:MAG TPA: hypothetical protein VFX70_12990 [Mycobacteriales bacterium]|nr:hypothetical protein [Mycobacteriales bacterium]